MNVLLAEDDPELARQIMAWLTEAHHTVVWYERGQPALNDALKGGFQVFILDVGLPDIDGFAVVEKLRGAGGSLPVLFLTARDSVTDRVLGLKVGGDDYLTKPFAVEELLARIEALHRRAATSRPSGPRKLGNWTMDPIQRRLRDGDAAVELQPREWTLLEFLMANEGRTLTKSFLLEKVWDVHFDPGTNVVDAMICRLRGKIDRSGERSFITTVRAKGYVFQSIP